VLELRQIERTLKLEMERLQTDTVMAEPPRRMIQNTLTSRTLTALPGEVFVYLCRIPSLVAGASSPATCKRQVTLRNHALSRRESFANEPSFRLFFRARFRAKACFTRRLSPGFK